MLVESFKNAWDYIGRRYAAGVICSERHLQAELFHVLYCDPSFIKQYDLRIEPVLYESVGKEHRLSGLIPDLLVTRDNTIMAHVEIKYVPHGFVQYKKDVASMTRTWNLKANQEVAFYLDTNPQNGEWNYERPYKVGKEFKMIYCMIGNEDSDCFVNNKSIWDGENKEMFDVDIIQFVGRISKASIPVFEQLDLKIVPPIN